MKYIWYNTHKDELVITNMNSFGFYKRLNQKFLKNKNVDLSFVIEQGTGHKYVYIGTI